MIISLSTIPHNKHRYPTVGDWIVDNANIPAFTILVSDMGNPDFEFLVGLHEQIETYLCWKRGIEQQSVDKFDTQYETNRPEGDFSEPGDDPKAPYFREHQFATKLERLMADELGVDWEKYNTTVEGL
jgi:hypothetical protein